VARSLCGIFSGAVLCGAYISNAVVSSAASMPVGKSSRAV